MSGVEVLGAILTVDGPLLAVVPAARIMGGDLPQGITLPAIVVTSVSGSDWAVLKADGVRRVSERVSATVLANNYAEQKAVIRLIRTACADKRGDFGGVTEVSITTDVRGPDMRSDDNSIWFQSQDFSVSFNEPA
jgi:hypothetical protein